MGLSGGAGAIAARRRAQPYSRQAVAIASCLILPRLRRKCQLRGMSIARLVVARGCGRRLVRLLRYLGVVILTVPPARRHTAGGDWHRAACVAAAASIIKGALQPPRTYGRRTQRRAD